MVSLSPVLQTHYQELRNKIGSPLLANQRLAKIVCTLFKAIYYDRAPKRIKALLDFRSEGTDI